MTVLVTLAVLVIVVPRRRVGPDDDRDRGAAPDAG